MSGDRVQLGHKDLIAVNCMLAIIIAGFRVNTTSSHN